MGLQQHDIECCLTSIYTEIQSMFYKLGRGLGGDALS